MIEDQSMARLQKQLVLAGSLFCSLLAFSQAPPFGLETSPSSTSSAAAIAPAVVPCAKPASTFDLDDYNGPLSKLIGSVSNKVELKTVHTPPHRPAGTMPCSLSSGEKFHLFIRNTFEPVNFMGSAWDAGWAQRDDDDRAFGQGAAGYGKRYAAALTDNVADDFFNTFLYPSLFHQDPRYYRMGHGSVHARLGHALTHVFVAHGDSGKLMFNYSEWFGTASSKALSNLYHPDNERGFASVADRAGVSLATDTGWNVFREFWPEIAHTFHLPFKNDYALIHPPARDSIPETPRTAEKPASTPAGTTAIE
jgi:hypothetical protein